MKLPALSTLATFCLLRTAQNAEAAPAITEIRLSDYPGYIAPPIPQNQFVFRANGDFIWLEGTTDHPVRHAYSIGSQGWQRLASAFGQSPFFSFKNSYNPLADAGSTALSVTRGGKTKTVDSYDGPQKLWELKMLVRGLAIATIGLHRTPSAAIRSSATPPSTKAPALRGSK